MTPAEQFNFVLETARRDPNILALWLGGSRGKGLITEHSDYDCGIVVKDEVLAVYRQRFAQLRTHDLDLSTTTLDEFSIYAAWGSETSWDRYSFAHVKALVDKLGIVQKMIDEKATIPGAEVGPLVRRSLDHYVNQVYRSMKCHRDGNLVGWKLDAAESINSLLDALFALNGRLRPYHKYLEWELENYPLEKPAISSEELVTDLLAIVATADISVQRVIFNRLEDAFRANGYGDVLDAWGEDLSWIKSYEDCAR